MKSLWSPFDAAELARAECAARGVTLEQHTAAAVERHRAAMEAAGYAGPDGEAREPVTPGVLGG